MNRKLFERPDADRECSNRRDFRGASSLARRKNDLVGGVVKVATAVVELTPKLVVPSVAAYSHSSMLRGQSSLSSRDSDRSARTLPSV